VIDIFNFYIKNGFAAYPEETLPYSVFNFLLLNFSRVADRNPFFMKAISWARWILP